MLSRRGEDARCLGTAGRCRLPAHPAPGLPKSLGAGSGSSTQLRYRCWCLLGFPASPVRWRGGCPGGSRGISVLPWSSSSFVSLGEDAELRVLQRGGDDCSCLCPPRWISGLPSASDGLEGAWLHRTLRGFIAEPMLCRVPASGG